MKIKDIHPGLVCWTKVGGVLTQVEVVAETTQTAHGTHAAVYGSGPKRMTKFTVKRVDNGQILPKRRSPAALRLTNEPLY